MQKNIENIFNLDKELTDLRQVYNQKAVIGKDKYGVKNDTRLITYFKILNIIKFYQIQRLHINNYVYNAPEFANILQAIKMYDMKEDEKNEFAKLYDTYITFGFFVQLFCAIESSLRLIHKELHKPEEINKHIPLDTVMDNIITKTNIDYEYKNLISLLATIRNSSMHNYGMNIKYKPIEYKGEKHEFKKSFIEKKYRSIDFTLNLVKNDILKMFNDIFESEIISNINFIEDDLEF